MKFLKPFFVLIFSVHFVCVFLASIDSWALIDKKYTRFAYIDSFFKQGWSFFAPDPVLSNTEIEYKCIYQNKTADWVNFESELNNSLLPWSKILRSANTSYIAETLAGPLVFGTTQRSNMFCSNGDCDQYFLEVSKLKQYSLLKKIVSDLCHEKGGADVIGDRVKIKTYNLSYFSTLKNSLPKKTVDSVLLPIHEYSK